MTSSSGPREVSKMLTEDPLTITAWLAIFVPAGIDMKALTRTTGCHKTMERLHSNSTRDSLDMDRLGTCSREAEGKKRIHGIASVP